MATFGWELRHARGLAVGRETETLWHASLTGCLVAATFILAQFAAVAQGQALKKPLDSDTGPEVAARVDDTDDPYLLYGPLTTCPSDALTEAPFLDDFNPEPVLPIRLLPRAPEGGFRLVLDGVFEHEFQSYCMVSGKRRPEPEDGLLYAPLRGPAADIFQKILRGAPRNPDVPQGEVQQLLWIIFDRETFEDLDDLQNSRARRPAERLLSAADRARLGQIARDQIARLRKLEQHWKDWADENERLVLRWEQEEERELEKLEKQQEKLKKELDRYAQDELAFRQRLQRAVLSGDETVVDQLQAERRNLNRRSDELKQREQAIQQRRSKATTTWKLEGLKAVATAAKLTPLEQQWLAKEKFGIETTLGSPSRGVPKGRWSYHLDGFFIRYFATGSYFRTRVQIAVPERIPVERDDKGRIIAVGLPFWDRIETAYDDESALTVEGDSNVKGYKFRSIRLVRPSRKTRGEKPQEARWENQGWTLVGVPSDGGAFEESKKNSIDVAERYRWAVAHLEQVHQLDQGLSTLRRRVGHPSSGINDASNSRLRELVELASYTQALHEALNSQPDAPAWANRHLDLLRQAWMWSYWDRDQGHEEKGISVLHSRKALPVSTATLLLSSAGSGWSVLTATAVAPDSRGQRVFRPSNGAAMPDKPDKQPLLVADAADEEKEEKCWVTRHLIVCAEVVLEALDEVELREGEKPSAYCARVNDYAADRFEDVWVKKAYDFYFCDCENIDEKFRSAEKWRVNEYKKKALERWEETEWWKKNCR